MLKLAIGLFVIGLRGVGASMILQVELSIPDGNIPICLGEVRMQYIEEVPRRACFHMRESGQKIHSPAHFQHISRDTAATVPISIRDQDVMTELFVLELSPAANDSMRRHHAIIGGIARGSILAFSWCINEIGHDFAAIDAAPEEEIMGNRIILIPADLRGHKGVDFAELKNLRQGPAVAKHVRQP